ncbi:HD domain-containing protein [Acetitomaculum ruminis DSM 5522]|uniref:HD domain-containing protein n=1 Tax=Acetitomaculum ruminis DSM 5522 TaxID=1120918 RepID=A0A1I0W4Q7_9FIRM|nr:HD domain-containing protein [Acetitomaculum ruminis]SFA83337.1 HD domain-containing protein [Acetitomaculum ruminis DSM 5522]
MIYTKLTMIALNIAYAAHAGAYDKGHVPYVFHPLHVAEEMDDEYSTAAALLHDVVEDSSWTLDDLRREGIPEEVIEVVDLLTHTEGVTYHDYIMNLTINPIAVKVKMADLRHNMDESRILEEDRKPDFKLRIAKYRKEYEYLKAFRNMHQQYPPSKVMI